MTSNNVLRIKAHALDLELKGDPEYIEMAYRAVRSVLMERFRESLEDNEARANAPVERATEELPVITQEELRQHRAAEPKNVHLALCDEVYNKVYLVDGKTGISGALGKVLVTDHISRIYINRSQQEHFTTMLKFERVLWRELTSAGRDVVRKGR